MTLEIVNNKKRIFTGKYKCLLEKYSKDEINYFQSLNNNNKNKILDLETQINNFNINKEPLRFKLLSLNTTIENKIVILRKYEELLHLEKNSSEYSKLFKWITTITYIPFGIYKEINYKNNTISNFLNDIKNGLDKNIYGHSETKQQLIRILAQYISNPNAKGYVIGIQGSMGIGKTKFIKDGIAKVINYPLAFIPLGGISDSSYLKGHSYTYESSTNGKIVDQLIKCKAMNPIIFFDELDKVSDSRYGEEIINTLIHITDGTQNDKFTDKYIEDIDLDLSKSLIFFTFNNIENISRILLDRMIVININKYTREDKLKLTRHSLLETIHNSYNLKINDVTISDEMIYYIIDNTTEEDGVRNLQRNINNIYSYINLNRYMPIVNESDIIKFPYDITKEFINKYIILKKEDNKNNLSMYL
jgi:ATP-dependent Lon protease